MIQRTLGQVRPEIASICGSTGMSVTDPRVIVRINLAQEELYFEGDFPGVVDRWHIIFDEITGELVLPYYLDRLMQVTVDRVPAQIMSPWAEFVQYGVGPRDDVRYVGDTCRPRSWIGDCLDRGEVVSRFPIPRLDGPWVIRCYATVNEDVASVSPVINLQGYAPDGRLVRTQGASWYNGENLEIDFSVPFTETVAEFARLTAVVKPRTNGYVRIAAWNGTTEVTLSDYAPVETTPSYRNYYIQQLYRPVQGQRARVVLARARRRFVPVAANDDVLIIGNINALKCMVIAQWKRDANNWEDYAAQKAQAVDILRKEATGYRGAARTPAISFQYGNPIGAFPSVR